MNDELYLHAPAVGDLWFRREMMADPATMAYNRGYDLEFCGYHPDTGCIDFPESEWESWHGSWVGREPDRFYAYLARKSDGAFVGEVCLHRADGAGRYEMGVVIESRYRGRGYSHMAMALLLDRAFNVLGASCLLNSFEPSRAAALRCHLKAGFRVTAERDGILELSLSREEYQRENIFL